MTLKQLEKSGKLNGLSMKEAIRVAYDAGRDDAKEAAAQLAETAIPMGLDLAWLARFLRGPKAD